MSSNYVNERDHQERSSEIVSSEKGVEDERERKGLLLNQNLGEYFILH